MKKINVKGSNMKDKKNIFEFIIIFLALLFKYMVMWDFIDKSASAYILVIAVIYSIIIIFNNKIYKCQLKRFVMLGLCSVWIYYTSGAIDFIISFLFAISFCNIKDGDYKYIRYFAISSIILFVTTLFLNYVGVLKQAYSQRIINGEYVIRNNLGFAHVNSVFLYFIPIVLALKLTNSKASDKLFKIAVLVCSVIIYYYTKCRTGMLVIVLIYIIDMLKVYFKNSKVKFVIKYEFIIFTIMSIVMALYFTNTFINVLLSNRPFYWSKAMEVIGFSVLGRDPIKTIPLDNMYITYLINYGYISYFIYAVIYVKIGKKICNNNLLIIVFTIFNIYGLFENAFVYCNNFTLVLGFIYLLNCNTDLMHFLKEEDNFNEEVLEEKDELLC